MSVESLVPRALAPAAPPELTKPASVETIYPSYTRLVVPYRVICRQRYKLSGLQQSKQFLKEHASLEMSQPRALDGVRLHREFYEAKLTPEDAIKISDSDKRKIERLLEYGIMFKNTHQSGFLSILYSIGSKPLDIWGQQVRNGHIKRVTDEDVRSLAIEIMGTNVATTYIICPSSPKETLGIRLPFFVMIVKNMKKYFSFEIQILDDKNMSRRFRVSNYQSTTRVRPFCTTMPIGLSAGWNQIQFNLADFTRRAYGSSYLETLRVQIHANVRIRRIYFSDRLYCEEEMPQEFRLYLPITDKTGPQKPGTKSSKDKGEPEQPPEEKKVSMAEEPEAKVPSTELIPSGAPPTPVETSRQELSEAVEEPQPEAVSPVDEIPLEDMQKYEEGAEMEDQPMDETVRTEGNEMTAEDMGTEMVSEAPTESQDVTEFEAPTESAADTESAMPSPVETSEAVSPESPESPEPPAEEPTE